MPRLGGLELGRRITALGWPIPVLYMSANPPDAAVSECAGLAIAPCLRKPFSVTTLITMVDRLLTVQRRSAPPSRNDWERKPVQYREPSRR